MSRSRNAVFAGTAPAFACAETFFKTLKAELETLDGKHTASAVQNVVLEYIEACYNRKRMQAMQSIARRLTIQRRQRRYVKSGLTYCPPNRSNSIPRACHKVCVNGPNMVEIPREQRWPIHEERKSGINWISCSISWTSRV
jgi:hypothetical protein